MAMYPRVKLRTLELLALGPLDKHQLVVRAFCNIRTAARTLDTLHKAGLVHIVCWQRNNGGPIPTYARGPGVDAARPKAETASEKARKRRSNPDVALNEMMAKRAARFLARMQRSAATTAQ